MRNDSFDDLWQECHGHSKIVDPFLIQTWVRDTWREISEARTWSWLRRKLLIPIPAPYVTGTCTPAPGSNIVNFAGAALTQSMVGQQFRQGLQGSIYEIRAVNTGASSIQIWPAFNDPGTTFTNIAYKIFTCYITPPDSDFFAWITVTNPGQRKRLRLHVLQEEIDYHDSPRSLVVGSSGSPACLSGVDWTVSAQGRIYPTQTIFSNSGSAPVSGGVYTGQTDSVFVLKVTVQGAVGVAQFTYAKDSAIASPNTLSNVAGNFLADGVYATFPSGVTFMVGDAFVIRVSSQTSPGVPRYELYPHPSSALMLNCLYATRTHDIDEQGFVLPYTIPGSVVKLGTLAKMARRYPGTDQKPNTFSQTTRAKSLEDEYHDMIGDLMTADDYIMETNVLDRYAQMEEALLPWMTTSGTGIRSTPEFDERDVLFRY